MSTPPAITVKQLEQQNLIAPKDESVGLSGLDARILLFLAGAGQAHVALFHAPLEVTSGRDSTHANNSKHFQGKAVDLHVHDLAPEELPMFLLVVDFICLRVGCGVFHEFVGLATEHFHVETND
jgi:hypothetical protein